MGRCRCVFLTLFLPFVLSGAQTGPDDHPRVFPGARGFGVRTPAGRGGRIIRVTNVNTDGAGSLREALAGRGPRIVVFEAGGVIDLQGRNLDIVEPFVTVAGQTAPSPGITLIRGSVVVKTHDVLVRHLRVRPGLYGPRRPAWEPGIGAYGPEAYNVDIDHCSISWAPDASLSASGSRYEGPVGTSRNITFSSSIIAESLSENGRGRPNRSGGSLVHDSCTNVAVIGNLYAHCYQDSPAFQANTTGAVVNNVIYNPGHTAIHLDLPPSEWTGRPAPANAKVSVAGNVLIYGGDTVEGLALISRKGDAFVADNLAYDRSGFPAALTAGLINLLSEKPAWPRGLIPLPAARTVEFVLRHAGARPKDRDEVDRRIVASVHEHKGRLIASQDEVGGYPKAVMSRRRLTVPPEDLDEWLARLAADVE
jgi:hypothetical protein